MKKFVQYGCSYYAANGWINYDSSPSLLLSRIPVVGSQLYRFTRNREHFPKNVKFGNIVHGLPEQLGSCDGIYASHVLEHLSKSGCVCALQNTYLLLKPGGVFRVIVPDLESRVRRYLSDLESGSTDANDRFLRSCYLGRETDPRGIAGRLRKMYGAADHLWMYDNPSMIASLESIGFTSIRHCSFGDSDEPMFTEVENRDRFFDSVLGVHEVAIEARRPPT